MLILDASDEIETRYVIHRAGLSLKEISERLNDEYGVKLSQSGVSHVINRGSVRLQRALQILAICGVSEVGITQYKR